MKIIRAGQELSPGRVCLAIGVFDGVHVGHQAVIRQTISDAEQMGARPVVVTFDRHPNAVVAPDRVPPLLYSLPQKLRAIGSLRPDATLLIHFDTAFSRQTGEEFIRRLWADFGAIASICVGRNFTFGHKRSGDLALLQRLGKELGFVVHGLAAVAIEGKAVSSTRIREAVQQGQLSAASVMLGRQYSLAGVVVRGDQVGRQLGFPTANIDTAGLLTPPTGVYAGWALAKERTWPSVINIGYRPSFEAAQRQLRVEAHLLDAHVDLYGQELELVFVSKIREEQKFPSLLALKEQIGRDVEAGRKTLGGPEKGAAEVAGDAGS